MTVFLAIGFGIMATIVVFLALRTRQVEPEPRRRGEGAARILSGVLAAYTGGASAGVTGALGGGNRRSPLSDSAKDGESTESLLASIGL